MSCHLQLNFLPYPQKGDGTAGVDFSKVKNDVTD